MDDQNNTPTGSENNEEGGMPEERTPSEGEQV